MMAGVTSARGCLIPLAVIAAVICGVLAYGIDRFSRSEARIRTFCQTVRGGDDLSDIERRARDAGLTTRRRPAVSSRGPAMIVSGDGSLLSGDSFCSIYHDGLRAREVYYNPWYH